MIMVVGSRICGIAIFAYNRSKRALASVEVILNILVKL